MRKDAHNAVKRCHTCQVHGNLIHRPSTLLQDMKTPWPFHTWGLDLIGITINPPSGGYKWILTATEYFKKWVSRQCHFEMQQGLLSQILSGNTLFADSEYLIRLSLIMGHSL